MLELHSCTGASSGGSRGHSVSDTAWRGAVAAAAVAESGTSSGRLGVLDPVSAGVYGEASSPKREAVSVGAALLDDVAGGECVFWPVLGI